MTQNRLTEIRYVEMNKWGNARYLYRCKCGSQIVTIRKDVRVGKTRSCGCLRREHLKKAGLKSQFPKGHQMNIGNDYWKKRKKKPQSPSKGKIRLYDPPNQRKKYTYITQERADAMYWGLDGEIHSARLRPAPWNKGRQDVKTRSKAS